MLNKDVLSKIKDSAVKKDWDDAFGGKSRGNRHLFRIVEIAKFLAVKTGANLCIVEAGALLHDTSLSSGDDSNYERNKQIILELLKQFSLSKSESDNIAECVASHEGIIKPKTLEAKIVHDADVLEKSGLLGIIRHTWKLTNSKNKEMGNGRPDDKMVAKVFNHLKWRAKRIQTPLAKKMNRYLNVKIAKRQARKIIEKTFELARKGVITEKIADTLLENGYLNKIQASRLKEQLDLTFLKRFE